MTDNQIDNYNALQKQNTENRKLIKKLQLDKQALKEQLHLTDVVVPKGKLCEVCNNDQVFETEDGYTADCPRCN
jgi:hypothetical protein